MIAYFVYTRYYDFEKQCVTVGGVQTYIQGLVSVFKSLGFECCIFQTGISEETHLMGDGLTIRQVNTQEDDSRPKQMRHLIAEIMKQYHNEEDFLIFLANEITCPNHVTKSIAIQHGISWDTLCNLERPEWRNIISFVLKARASYRIINKLNEVKHIVCVDHNFPNWLRATAVHFKLPMTVIPNFTKIAPICKKPKGCVNIIFARRFYNYRGTQVFARAMQKVLDKNEKVFVTIAGSGPDEEFLRDTLTGYGNRVRFIQYEADESLQIHSEQHIAVVPTLGSEGTSLSLLEAMSAQCATVSTDIGGLSNIVIDGYNALYTEPNSVDLARKIQLLIDDEMLREQIARRAYDTVRYGFSYETWTKRWRSLIEEMMEVNS